MRKVYVDVTTRLVIEADDTTDVNEVLEEMNYIFAPAEDAGATIVDTEITGWEITDSK